MRLSFFKRQKSNIQVLRGSKFAKLPKGYAHLGPFSWRTVQLKGCFDSLVLLPEKQQTVFKSLFPTLDSTLVTRRLYFHMSRALRRKFTQFPACYIFGFRVIKKYWAGGCRSSHQMCSIKKLFLKISQYSQRNTCVGVSF